MRTFLLFSMALLSSSSIIAQQFLPVKSIVNARDLGGYTMRDGRILRDGIFLRAAHLADVTDEDLHWLSGVPVAKVIDFRTALELQGQVDKDVPGATYVSLPIDASGRSMANVSEKERKKYMNRKKFDIKKFIVLAAFDERAKAAVRNMYPTLLFDPDCQKQYARFFRLVLETENGAVLYHCTQGKDRTGIASALLLGALGAGRETIIADFDATNKVYEKDVKKYSRRVRLWGGKEEEIAVVKAILGCSTENFIKALDTLESRYGSMEAYLKGPMGLTDEDIQTLQDRCLK